MTTIEIVKTVGLCTIQDLGRRGHMHEAVPPGGALVPDLLVAANRHVKNLDGAACIEVLGQVVLRATEPVEIATDREGPRMLDAGHLTITSEPRRVAYIAVRGGFDVPVVLGGRGTLTCAELGRPLARGEALHPIAAPEERWQEIPRFDESGVVHVIAGPDDDAFVPGALDHLERQAWRIAPTSDRVGTRLIGTKLDEPMAIGRTPTYRERSRPMVIGAIEVPRDGQPIVLGPEHPTTGGYPILGVVASQDLGRFFATRPSGIVRFRVARGM